MSSVSSQLQNLSASQIQMARVIEKEFLQAGYDSRMVIAALLNAIAESGLDPLAVGDQGRSVGLFQLNIHGGGTGMSVADRQDPVKNTRRILEVVGKSRPLLEAWKRGDSSTELTKLFCIHVERPSNATAKSLARAASLYKYLPGVLPQITSLPVPAEEGKARGILLLGLATLLVGGAAWLVRRWRGVRTASQ